MRAGEADHALHLCRNLANSGLEVDVLTTEGNSCAETLFSVHPIMSSWAWWDLLNLRKFLKRCAPDAVMLMYSGWVYKNQPMITFAPSFCKRLLPNVPFVTQFEFDEGARLDEASLTCRIIRKIIKQLVGSADVDWEFGTLLRDSDNIIVLSDHYRKKFLQHLAGIEKKTLLLPPPPIIHFAPERNGETRRLARDKFGIAADEFLIAYFGYVHHNKGIDTLLKALQLVGNRRTNVRLILVGGTEDDNSQREGLYARELVELAKRLGISDRITWTGTYAPDSDFGSMCLRGADACALPYDNGVTLNRSSFAVAVAHGLPTITTRADELEPQFVDGKNVLLCPPKDPVALASAIDGLMSNGEIQRQLKSGALDLAHEWYSWPRTMKLTLSALRGIEPVAA